MAGKADTTLKNKHHLISATSGGGKSAWLKAKIKNVSRLIAWDPDEEYTADRYRSKSEFLRAVNSGVIRKGKFRIALSLDATPANFEWFCKVVWAVADCRLPISVVVEEIADVTTTSKAPPVWGSICRRGRKYGLTLYAITQRPAECDKTIYSQAGYKWVGILDNEMDRKRFSQSVGLSIPVLAAMNPYDFYLKEQGAKPAKKGRVKKWNG